LEVILVDVMESRAQRPKRNRQRNKKPIKNRKNGQKRWYSSKKKYHTIKSQIVICAKTKIIIAVFVDCGRTHDFAIWKKTIGGESSETHQNPSGQGLYRHRQAAQKQRDSEEKDEKTNADQRGEGEQPTYQLPTRQG